jgi:Leucine-rich repeat (LRR) protein
MSELPPSIALLTNLIELDLSLNRFTSIDAIDFLQMSKLTLLNVSIRLLCQSTLSTLTDRFSQLHRNQLGPSLNRNWNDATSLIELNISENGLTSIDNLPFDRMSRLVDLDVCATFFSLCAVVVYITSSVL